MSGDRRRGWKSIAGWPLIPLSAALALMFVCGAVCVIALLYDSGARDTGRVTQFGVLVLGVGILGCLGIGLWNVTVATTFLLRHQQNSYAATTTPPPSQQ